LAFRGSGPLVRMDGITKTFSGHPANSSIHFEVNNGEVHSLLGENGAGKTTLMNILCGIYLPDAGNIWIKGERKEFRSPRDSILSGIGMVHQHSMLVPSMTVWENMVLGLDNLSQFLPKKQIIGEMASLSSRYGLQVEPEAKIWQLSIGEQQRVSILKVLFRKAELLILDEPTAVLTPQESENLFKTVFQMKNEGHGIVFISHKLNEVLALSDRITILRKGHKVGTVNTGETTREALAEMMVGKRVSFTILKGPANPGEIAMELKDIFVNNDRGLPAVKGLSLQLRRGEILGIAGIAGNGQHELCETMVGLRKSEKGNILINGKTLKRFNPKNFIAHGVRYIPADRKGTGLVPNMNIQENAILKNYWQEPVSRGITINWRIVLDFALSIVRKFNVDTPSLNTPVRNLSGGNLQKLMLGRELSGKPTVLIAVHPTWGLDVAATKFVRDTILQEREKGAAILLVSEDLDELIALSDRLAVIHKGLFMGITDEPERISRENLGLMMAGIALEEIQGNEVRQ